MRFDFISQMYQCAAPPRMSAAFASTAAIFRTSRRLPHATTRVHHLRSPKMSTAAPTRRVLVPIGNGSEEIETSCVVDTLRRAGAEVTVASVEPSLSVKMSRGMVFQADARVGSLTGPFDAVALPGGMPGAQRLADCAELGKMLGTMREGGAVVGAICAAPAVVLAGTGMLDGKKATCYPVEGFRERIPNVADGDVVRDGQVVTATGPGTALKWSLELVEMLYGKELADKLGKDMLAPR